MADDERARLRALAERYKSDAAFGRPTAPHEDMPDALLRLLNDVERLEQALLAAKFAQDRANERAEARAERLEAALRDLYDVMIEAARTGGWVPSALQRSFADALYEARAALAEPGRVNEVTPLRRKG